MEKYFTELSLRYPQLQCVVPVLRQLACEIVELFRRDGTLFLAGNGGSAADPHTEHSADVITWDWSFQSFLSALFGLRPERMDALDV